MPRAAVICPVVGAGTSANPYRLKIADTPGLATHNAVIPSNPDGAPKFGWGLAIVDVASLAGLLADPDVDVLPRKALDGALSAQEKTDVQAALARRGLPNGTVPTLRQAIRRFGRHLDPNFEEERLRA